ncbi:cytochrome P450 [Xylariomycetidae sp. FL2044]|nr:cytochrome P450 [Xylariomycetidae sp. FL2044]
MGEVLRSAFLSGGTLVAAFTVTALLVFLYWLGSIVYSLTLHPLAKFPGPLLGASSRLPFWIACITGQQVTWMRALHEQYGPVVRYSPGDLSYVDQDGVQWRAIHGHEKGAREFPKAPEWFVTPANGIYGINSAPAHDDHRRFRHLFAPAFSDRALRRQEPIFQKHVNLLMTKLGETAAMGQPVDMVSLYQFTTFDIMGELTFGQPLGLMQRNDYSPWVKAVFDSIKIIPIAQFIQYYPWLDSCFRRLEPKSITEMKYNHFKHSADRVDRRLQEGGNDGDIWEMVLSAKGDEQLSLEEMYCHADVFMLAGSETTGTTLSAVSYYLVKNPDKMARLAQEVRSKFDDPCDITIQSTAGLTYMNACIDEALRLFPPVPVGVPRVVPEPGRMIGSEWVTGGTRVSVHHYSTYRTAANFTDSQSFHPERWLGDEAFQGDRRECFQPFAYGPRDCLGRNMGMHEMRLILARLLLAFDMELCEESTRWDEARAFILWEKKPLMCRLKPRNGRS